MSHIQPIHSRSAEAEVRAVAYKLVDLCERHALSVEEVIQAASADRLNTLASVFQHRK